jgi:hypothetical protein
MSARLQLGGCAAAVAELPSSAAPAIATTPAERTMNDIPTPLAERVIFFEVS